jgi:two-component sensor histidine kinase
VLIKNLHLLNDILLPDFYAEHGIVSTVDVIIQRESGTPYGVLEIDSPFEHAYDQHDINFLTGFTNVLAEAVATAERTEKLRQAIAAKDLLLAEKNMLAEELQHRVRNNLHIVAAMLNSEMKQQDPAHAEGVAAIARRVMTLSRVYDHLLGVGLSRTIDFGSYVRSLCSALPDIHGIAGSEVVVTCDSDALSLDLDTVTALGMVIAELVANSYKHAFPAGRGTISVVLRHEPGRGAATLTIADDGVGLPPRISGKRHGIGLVTRLMEQVGGTLFAKSGTGTEWELRFPVPGTAAG